MNAKRGNSCALLKRFRFVIFGYLFICIAALSPVPVASDVMYLYDSLNRLVEVRHPDKVIRYTYDDAGNRIGMTVEVLVSAPTITSLGPRGAVAGGSAFTLKVLGSNFSANSVVNWNGANRSTTFVSGNELRINVEPADIAGVGTASIVVVSPIPNIAVSNAQTFSVVQIAALSGQITAGGNPLPNVVLNLSGTEIDTVTTDTMGNFNFAVLNNGPYTISPTRAHYSFAPIIRNVNYSGVSQTNLDFVGSLVSYPITGRIATSSNNGLPGVSVSLSGSQNAQTTTDPNGNYTFNTTAQGNYTVTPTRPNYSFTPLTQTFANLSGAQVGNFTATSTRRTAFDFDGDGKTDVSIYRPSVGEWWIYRSSDGHVPAFQFGSATDRITPVDFTGDGKTDIAIWRPATGEWFVIRSENNTFYSGPFGTTGDIPAPADYDADGKADIAVFRPTTGFWFVQRSTDSIVTSQLFGANGDYPIPADYDGDGRADVAIYRPSVGEWWLSRTTAGVIAYGFGNSSDKIVPGDYTGDGKADVAFWRPATGEWFILRSEDTSYYSAPFGIGPDMPTPGDYDGDGKFDVAVFRPSIGTWFVNRTSGGASSQQFGANGDRPIPNAFVP